MARISLLPFFETLQQILGALLLLNTGCFSSDKKQYFFEWEALDQHGVGKININPPKYICILCSTNS